MLEGFSKENKEKKVSWSGTIGFDFIFIQDLELTKEEKIILKTVPICVELNGSNSAISGIQEISKGKYDKQRGLLAKIRGENNNRLLNKIELAGEVESRKQIGEKRLSQEIIDHLELDFSTPEVRKKVRQYMENALDKERLVPLSNQNPEFVKEICIHKKLQDKYIPEENRPKRWKRGVTEETRSGFWILKPDTGVQGKDIHIVSKNKFDAVMNSNNYKNIKQQKIISKHFVVEEFLKPLGAEEADEEHENNPASLRILMDFRVLDDGEIKIDTEFSYQRVSKYSKRREGQTIEDVYVVNRARGAKAFNTSKEEMDKCRPVCLEIIKRLNDQIESKKLKTEN